TPVRSWPSSASTFTLKATACFAVALPSRIAFRLPSGATNKMRLNPLGSFTTLAIVSPTLSFRPDGQPQERCKPVRHVEPCRVIDPVVAPGVRRCPLSLHYRPHDKPSHAPCRRRRLEGRFGLVR